MHNVERPVSFDEARRELGSIGRNGKLKPMSAYYLTALRSRLGIRGRVFMLSPIRDFLKSPEGMAFSTFAHYKKEARIRRIEFKETPKGFVVTMPGNPDVMCEDKSLARALETAGRQFELSHK